MQARSLVREVVSGSARGLVATAAMSVPMLVAGRAGVMGTLPPKRITEEAAESAGFEEAGETERNLASTAAHLGFGASMGAIFYLLRGRLRPPGPSVAHGLGYGLVVWAVSYKGWVPALGILPPPERDRPGRRRTNVLAHLVYGAVLGLLVRPHEGGPRRRRPGR